ncbi:oleosin S1-2 [Gastrolobium bilobum]|uniref:oleosin S1-2 n=1 Tax=Gastrolobium bilobum TaxID=150636 RepID=UPI002AB0E53F|nr:oleosin S1-2 [Gastrolobium bilobum]
MADYYEKGPLGRQSRQVSRTTVVSASLAAIAIGGPLLGMMGFTFLASTTLLLVCFPLLVLFSPLLLSAAFLLVATLSGFAVAIAMALTGLSMLGWIIRETRLRFGALSNVGDSGHIMKGTKGGYFATTTA